MEMQYLNELILVRNDFFPKMLVLFWIWSGWGTHLNETEFGFLEKECISIR